MGVWYSFSRFLFIIINIILMLFGIAGIVASAWMLCDPTFPASITQDSNDYLVSLIIILLSSITLFIVSIIGIYGCLREVKCSLVLFFSIVLVIVVVEVAACVWGYIYREGLEAQIQSSVKMTVKQEYAQDENRRTLFDTFQRELQCCGAEKPVDWNTNEEVNLAVTNEPRMYNIPKSCCRKDISERDCESATRNLKIGSEPNYKFIYDQGCYRLIMAKLKSYANTIFIVIAFIFFVQLLGLILSLALAVSINKDMRYKA